METKLVTTYSFLSHPKSSVLDCICFAEIVVTSRQHTTVTVQFNITDSGVAVSAATAVQIFHHLTSVGLQNHLGYKVDGTVQMVEPSKYRWRDVLGMVLTDSIAFNVSIPANQRILDARLVKVYKNLTKTNELIVVEHKHVSGEKNLGTVYIEFYMLRNGAVLNASHVADVYSKLPLAVFNKDQKFDAKVLPYAANAMLEYSTDLLVKMTIKPKATEDITSSSFQYEFAEKISEVYSLGKNRKGGRKRRATSSVQSQVKRVTTKDNQAEMVFMVIDGGKGVNGNDAVLAINKVPDSETKSILGVETFTKPVPYIARAEAKPDVEYWIIGAVIGSVLFVVLICLLFVWRWKVGGPKNKKINPEAGDIVEMNGKKPMEYSGPDIVSERKNTEQLSQKIPPASLETSFNEPAAFKKKSNELETSQRRKVPSRNQPYGRQNPAYDDLEEEEDESEEDEDESEEEDDDEEDEGIESEESEEHMVQIRKPIPTSYDPGYQQKEKRTGKPKLVSEVVTKPQIHQDMYQQPSPLPPPPRFSHPEVVNLPPVPSPNPRRPLEMTSNLMEDDEPNSKSSSYSAGQIPTFGHVKESNNLSVIPPVRFRTKIDNMDAYTKPAGPLPALDLKQTSLVAAPTAANDITAKIVDPELQHKSDLERLRNKQRQRERLFSASTPTEKSPQDMALEKKYWKKEQDRIDAVLNPELPRPITDISSRKGRLRRRLRRKNKIYMSADLPGIKSERMKSRKPYAGSFKNIVSPADSESTKELIESDAESEISMRETRRRIHNLLDDTFTTLKKYQKQLLNDDSPSATPIIKNNGHIAINSPPRKYAGMPPSLPEPAPAHGRATTTPHGKLKQRIIQNQFASPFNPYNPSFTDPMLTWDPAERQRYLNQHYGFPGYNPQLMFGVPNQNVYMTPVQQRPDGTGNMVWSPYNPPTGLSDVAMKPSTTHLPGETSYPTIPALSDFKPTQSTTLNDLGGKSSQPLIRAIKEELIKLSQSAQGRTRIQEINKEINNSSHLPGS